MTDKATDVTVTRKRDELIRRIMNENAEYINGVDRGQVRFGHEAVKRMIIAAMDEVEARHRTASEQPASGEVGLRVNQDWVDRRQKEPDAVVEAGAPIRQHVMPGDPDNLGQIALQWYLKFDFGYPHSVRESNVAVEAFKDGYRAALSTTSEAPEAGMLREALERIATVDMGGGFLGAQACRKVARAALSPPCEGAGE